MGKSTFQIVDFNVGNFTNRHLNYVIAYGLLLQEQGYTPKLFLPKYSPNRELRNLNFSVHRILNCRFYKLSENYAFLIVSIRDCLSLWGKWEI